MKAVKTAVIVVGVAALVATGVGAAAGFGIAAGVSQLALGAAALTGVSASVFTAALVGAAAFAAGSVLTAMVPKPPAGGSQTKWKADPYAGLPYVMGRTLVSGNIIYRRSHGSDNKYQTFVTVLSICTAASIDATFFNNKQYFFDASGNSMTDPHVNIIYQRTQLGRCPEPGALTSPRGNPPGWTAAHKLSGMPAVLNTFIYDNKGGGQLTTEPAGAWIGHWAKVYDPVLDSTYPGGSGPCRALQEDTYVWSDDPHLHGLTWCLGRFQNGRRVAGIGAPIASIDIASFVEGRNLNKARGWTLGGQVTTRPDTPWNSLTAMLQAGGARPVLIGGMISCINRAPRVSLATITRDDIVGDCTFSGTQPRRSRINGVIPTYRSEAHDWQMVPAKPVSVPEYVAQDGDERTKEIVYSLVQDVHQASQLAAYDVCDAREAGPGTVPLKPWWLNYRIGDCVTFEPEEGWSTKVMITGSAIEPSSGVVTCEIRTETDGKHDFALGRTGTPPETASISYDRGAPQPLVDDWTLSGVTLSAGGSSIPALRVTGGASSGTIEQVIFEFRPFSGTGDAPWIGAGVEAGAITRKEISGVTPGTAYEVAISYRVRGVVGERLVLGPVSAGALSITVPRASYTLKGQTVTYPFSSTDSSIVIVAFAGTLDDGRVINFPAATITGLESGTDYVILWDLQTSAYVIAPAPALAQIGSSRYVQLRNYATSSGGVYAPTPTRPGGDYGNGIPVQSSR